VLKNVKQFVKQLPPYLTYILNSAITLLRGPWTMLWGSWTILHFCENTFIVGSSGMPSSADKINVFPTWLNFFRHGMWHFSNWIWWNKRPFGSHGFTWPLLSIWLHSAICRFSPPYWPQSLHSISSRISHFSFVLKNNPSSFAKLNFSTYFAAFLATTKS